MAVVLPARKQISMNGTFNREPLNSDLLDSGKMHLLYHPEKNSTEVEIRTDPRRKTSLLVVVPSVVVLAVAEPGAFVVVAVLDVDGADDFGVAVGLAQRDGAVSVVEAVFRQIVVVAVDDGWFFPPTWSGRSRIWES